LSTGPGSALKTRKTTRVQICLRTEKDLENLQVNFETTNSKALKLTENANIENASTPTIVRKRHQLAHRIPIVFFVGRNSRKRGAWKVGTIVWLEMALPVLFRRFFSLLFYNLPIGKYVTMVVSCTVDTTFSSKNNVWKWWKIFGVNTPTADRFRQTRTKFNSPPNSLWIILPHRQKWQAQKSSADGQSK